MVAPRLAKIFSIAVIVTFLLSSIESAKNDCPKTLSISSKSTEKKKSVIVVFKSEAAAKRQYDMFKNCLDAEVDSFDKIQSLSSKNSKPAFTTFGVFGLFGLTGKMTPQLAKDLKEMEDIDYIEDDGKVQTLYAIPSSHLISRAVDNNPTFNIDRIDQAKRPTDGKYTFPDSAGQGVNIFVVDTGININHSEFGKRAKFGGSFCDGCNDKDENGHGTHVASIAAGKTLGVARKANLIAVRVLDAKGSGSNTGVINGLEFVGKQHSDGKNKNSVVNMSLGGAKSQAVNDAVAKLTAAGVHVVVAAGNEGQDACNTSPASELSAITVGATEKDNDAITDFSNFGKCVDTFAPGRDIEGADFQDVKGGTAVFSGTSQACPHVAGTVALIIAKDGNKSPDAMATEVKNLSTKGVVKGLKNGSPDSFLRIPSA